MISRILLVVFLTIFAVAFPLSAQDEYLDPDLNIDDLFNPEEAENPESGSAETDTQQTEEAEQTALVDIVRGSDVTFGGNFLFMFGYFGGWKSVPWIPGTFAEADGVEAYTHGVVNKTSSSFSLNFRIAPVFRIYLTFQFSFPEFKAEIGEFFADYSIVEAVFFRIGRQNHSWGISRYHPFTNLLNRLPDSWSNANAPANDYINDADSYSIKMNIPLEIGGFEFVGHTRYGYMSNPSSPHISDIGWGGTFNLAVPYLDATIGSYYHRDLPWRSFLSASTTVFQILDLYAEGMISYNMNFVPNDPAQSASYDSTQPVDMDALDFAVNGGFLIGFLKNTLNITGEYSYNGEERQRTVKGQSYPLIFGHNIAGGISWTFWENKFGLYAQINYSVNENSGLFVPALRLEVLPFMQINAALPLSFGNADGTYVKNNPTGAPVSFVISALLQAQF